MTFADACFDNQRQHDRLENVVLGALYDFMSRSDGWIKRLDPYDRSIEFWVSEGTTLDESEQAVLWTLGFHRCWLCESRDVHNGVEEGNGTERYYCNPEVARAMLLVNAAHVGVPARALPLVEPKIPKETA